MRIEIICTGDEVLTGKIVNSNFSYMSQKLEDFGLAVHWGTTVGDDREALLEAFRFAASRSDAVIVNGGLGPTIDDLSQEVAARAAGVALVLDEDWLARMEAFFRRRGRTMPPNNRKQAMLPAGSELLDNPLGTACGFALDIGKARFFFTPGVPRELRAMLENEIIPRLLRRSGEALAPEGNVKLGFRAHYPQLETKLTVRAADAAAIERTLAPIAAEVRRRLGNFILAEDDETLESVVLSALGACGGSLATVETFTGGLIAGRLAHLPGAEAILRRGVVAPDPAQLRAMLGIAAEAAEEAAAAAAAAARSASGASHALAVVVVLEEGSEGTDLGGGIYVAIATASGTALRRARIFGGRDWIRLGAVELGLDCLRRFLRGLPIDERIDFEKR